MGVGERRWKRVVLVTAMTVALLAAFYGPLFAWSPVKPGFATVTTGIATIHYRSSTPLTMDPAALVASLHTLENDVGLRFTGPIHVVLCDQWSDFWRFTPWLRVSHGVGAITLPIGLLTYVTPVVRYRADLGTFITHEGSHSLLYQHASIPHRLAMEQQAWLVEGIGVHFGNPRAYESPEEFARDSATRNVITTIDPEAAGHARGLGGFRFAYSAYGFFIDSLIKRFGRDAFHRFVAAYVTDPPAYRDVFRRVYGVDFAEAVRDFTASIGRGQASACQGFRDGGATAKIRPTSEAFHPSAPPAGAGMSRPNVPGRR